MKHEDRCNEDESERLIPPPPPVSLYPQGKSPQYPLDRRLSGPQSRSGRGGEEKNSQSRQKSNPRTPIVQPVA
jgi:hypothetical protein